MRNISDLEKKFYTQRNIILKGLNREEQILRRGSDKLLEQMAVLKKKQRQLQFIDGRIKKRLEIMQNKLAQMKRQEKEDKSTIENMKKRIRQLKVEIPTIEKNIRKIAPERDRIAKDDKKVTNMLKVLGRKIAKKQAMVDKLKSKVKRLDKKEYFIQHGKIVWGEFKPKQKTQKARIEKKRQAKKALERKQRGKQKGRSLLDIFSVGH